MALTSCLLCPPTTALRLMKITAMSRSGCRCSGWAAKYRVDLTHNQGVIGRNFNNLILECPTHHAKVLFGPSVVCMSTSDFKVRALNIYRDFHQTRCSAVSFVRSIRSVLPSFVFAFGAVRRVNLVATQPDLCVCVYGRRKVGPSLMRRRQRREDHMPMAKASLTAAHRIVAREVAWRASADQRNGHWAKSSKDIRE